MTGLTLALVIIGVGIVCFGIGFWAGIWSEHLAEKDD